MGGRRISGVLSGQGLTAAVTPPHSGGGALSAAASAAARRVTRVTSGKAGASPVGPSAETGATGGAGNNDAALRERAAAQLRADADAARAAFSRHTFATARDAQMSGPSPASSTVSSSSSSAALAARAAIEGRVAPLRDVAALVRCDAFELPGALSDVLEHDALGADGGAQAAAAGEVEFGLSPQVDDDDDGDGVNGDEDADDDGGNDDDELLDSADWEDEGALALRGAATLAAACLALRPLRDVPSRRWLEVPHRDLIVISSWPHDDDDDELNTLTQ